MKKFLLLILSILITTAVIAQTAQEYYDLADEKYQNKDYKYALTLVEKAIELDSSNVWNRLLRSDINIGLNRVEDAINDLGLAMLLDSTEAEVYNQTGILFMEMNYLDESIHFFDQAIHFAKDDSTKFSYYVNSATSKGVLRDFEGAIHDFEESYKIDSSNIVVLNNLAAVYQEIGEKQKGIKMMQRIIEIDPEFIGSYVNLGLTYSEIDSLELSEYYFDLAFKLDPEDPLLLNNRGFLYYKMKEYEKALADINKSIQIFPSNSYAYRNRALTYLALDLNEEACRDLSIAQYYDFKTRYGDEVEKLIEKHCENNGNK